MILKDISLDSPEANILLDEALFLNAEKHEGPEVLRFWESKSVFIVLGRIGKEYDDLVIPQVLKERIPVVRRTSGGGTVVQGPGCLNYTLVIDKNREKQLTDLRLSYQWISQKIIGALKQQGINAVFRPISDIAIFDTDKKFSGNAQRRGKNFILHHGTILYDFDLNTVFRLLQMPKDMPEYRRKREHSEFISNIPIDPQKFKKDLQDLFCVTDDQSALTPLESSLLTYQLEKFPFSVDIHP
ncbi:MAG: lipoate--protein ligase family protein [Candidatus Omnitrophica bacterium]|nr:lipoate--protein ligase family protein [Candidatus Omnitrophota bacterium]